MRALVATLLACALIGAALPVAANDLIDRLRDYRLGSFTSKAQHEADPERYAEIEQEVVEIWADRGLEGLWVYAESAQASAKDRPYLQRIVHYRPLPDGRVAQDTYEFPDAAAFAGAWREPDRFDAIDRDSLMAASGCTRFIEGPNADGMLHATTKGRDCANDYRGAAYAVSMAEIGPEGYTNWDRGFDADGTHVWGPAEGGYRFRRK